MFQGHTICSFDSKSRIIFPSKFRKYMKPEADNKLICTRGMEGCILVYPLNEWEKFTKGLSRLNVFDPKKRFFMREFMKYVNECELDSQNRILIPAQLVEHAKLENEVIIIGMLDKLEIWNPKLYEEYESKQEITYEEVAKTLSEEIFKDNE